MSFSVSFFCCNLCSPVEIYLLCVKQTSPQLRGALNTFTSKALNVVDADKTVVWRSDVLFVVCLDNIVEHSRQTIEKVDY